ncbi:MAG: pyridoxal-phosphate dependent enzyme [Candidatus Dormibacteraeota bacterium]|nr:pyridoxal-phosphate dependent enzyme [Candidatus Dormibacteraeota bacterium]
MKATGLDLEAIRRATPVVAQAAMRTPLVRLNVWDGPGEIYLKLENLQPIGSFKIRGAANAMSAVSREELRKGVLVASAGNMAQGAAWNARRLGIPCTVIAPDYAPLTKIAAIERLGGRVIKVPFDRWWQCFTDRGYPGIDAVFIHSFDDDRVMAGNGTIGIELIEDLPDVDTVLIPWGGGGLAIGIATALRALKPGARIYAVEADTGAPLAASLQAGRVATVDYQPSFVDGIGSKTVFPNMLALAQELLDGSLTAGLDEIASALRLMAERNRVIAEGAGAVALAVARSGKAGRGRIACVVSGGNIDLAKLAGILGEPR